MKVISFYNAKGGTGKTSLSYLMANFLSGSHRVLAIDLDPQASLSMALSIEVKENSIYDYLTDSKKLSDCIYKSGFEKIDLIQSSIKVLETQNNIIQNQLKTDLVKMNYDYVIIDNSPSFNSLIVSSIVASDTVIIPSMVSSFDFDSVNFSLKKINKIRGNLNNTLIVLNRVGKDTKELNDYMNYFNEFKDVNFFKFLASNNIRKIIDRKQSLESKGNQKIYESIMLLIKELNL